jgi:hypothetical protein
MTTKTKGMEATHALPGAEALVVELAIWVISASVLFAAAARPRATRALLEVAMTVQEAEAGKARWKKRSIWVADAKESGVYHAGMHRHCANPAR